MLEDGNDVESLLTINQISKNNETQSVSSSLNLNALVNNKQIPKYMYLPHNM